MESYDYPRSEWTSHIEDLEDYTISKDKNEYFINGISISVGFAWLETHKSTKCACDQRYLAGNEYLKTKK